MTVQDLDWEGGAKLLDYQIVDDGQPADANLRVKVRLTTSGARAGGKKHRENRELPGHDQSLGHGVS